jgi:hypothetical protein
MSAEEYVNRGATTVLAFGPILLRDGEMADVDKKEYNYEEPRSCLGLIEPGHYVGCWSRAARRTPTARP